MIWLDRPPWSKWVAVAAFSLFALWMEVKPEPVVDHPFATTDIEAGEQLGTHNTELRPLPKGLLEAPEAGAHALAAIPAGAPVLAAHTGDESSVMPRGWLIVSMDVPQGALTGDRVKIALLDDGDLIDGVISSTGDSDGLTSSLGGVAVPSDLAPRVALAAIAGRVSVLVATD